MTPVADLYQKSIASFFLWRNCRCPQHCESAARKRYYGPILRHAFVTLASLGRPAARHTSAAHAIRSAPVAVAHKLTALEITQFLRARFALTGRAFFCLVPVDRSHLARACRLRRRILCERGKRNEGQQHSTGRDTQESWHWIKPLLQKIKRRS